MQRKNESTIPGARWVNDSKVFIFLVDYYHTLVEGVSIWNRRHSFPDVDLGPIVVWLLENRKFLSGVSEKRIHSSMGTLSKWSKSKNGQSLVVSSTCLQGQVSVFCCDRTHCFLFVHNISCSSPTNIRQRSASTSRWRGWKSMARRWTCSSGTLPAKIASLPSPGYCATCCCIVLALAGLLCLLFCFRIGG